MRNSRKWQSFVLAGVFGGALFFAPTVFAQSLWADAAEGTSYGVFADRKALLFITLSGIAGATSWLFYFMALKTGTVSQVAPIDKLSVVFAVVLAVILFHEEVSLLHAAAIALIAVGGLMLALF